MVNSGCPADLEKPQNLEMSRNLAAVENSQRNFMKFYENGKNQEESQKIFVM